MQGTKPFTPPARVQEQQQLQGMDLYEPEYDSFDHNGVDWDVHCLVCGAPSLNPAKMCLVSRLANLPQEPTAYDWLDKCIGIPEDNVLIELGLYDHQGDFQLPNNRLFGPYPSYAQAPRTDNKLYGLNCHAKCYQVLRDRLGYRLRYQDI